MEYIFHPAAVISLSILIGVVSRMVKAPRWAAHLLPPLLIFSLMSYANIFLPYKGGGASFWPIGEVVASGAALVSSIVGYFLAGYLVKKK